MSIPASSIKYYRSSSGASAGGSKSATAITNNVKNNFFDDILDASRIAGGSVAKKYFLANEDASISMVKPLFWFNPAPTNIVEELGYGWDDPDDDTATQGNMSAFTGSDKAAIVSTGPDTRTVQLVGIDSLGEPVSESLVLNGVTEALSVATFSKLYAARVSAENATFTVTIAQGAGGPTRGIIGPNTKCCWLWISPIIKASGIRLPTLAPGASIGFWDRLTWSANAPSTIPNVSTVDYEEGS